MASGLIILALLVPALRERQRYYALNTQMMEGTRKALDADGDARAILSALQELPSGRTYAGLRGNWGKEMKLGGIHFYDLLTFHRIVAILPPYQGHSLNADFIFHFQDRDPAHYNLFNVRYVVAPSSLAMPTFLRAITTTPRYTLYRAETNGYAQFVAATETRRIDSQSDLFLHNRGWFLSADPPAGRFIRYEYPSAGGRSATSWDRAASRPSGSSGCPGGGGISEERVLPGRIDLRVECRLAATLVLKVTYHPNWQATIDGERALPSMLSPSFIGLHVPAGLHHVSVQYRSGWLKSALLLLGAFTLIAAIRFRQRFTRLDAKLCLRL
jgi:hypothetical protein